MASLLGLTDFAACDLGVFEVLLEGLALGIFGHRSLSCLAFWSLAFIKHFLMTMQTSEAFLWGLNWKAIGKEIDWAALGTILSTVKPGRLGQDLTFRRQNILA